MTIELAEPDVPRFLHEAAKTFAQRNALYGDNYKRFGSVLLATFPDSKVPEIRTLEDANRLQLLVQILNKCTRYAENLTKGGHADSAHDLIVYSAMLLEATEHG